MPVDGLTVGGAASRGVRAFLQSYQQGKMYEHQEKMQKNAVVVELLSKQLEDPNTTYNDRTKILRSIPRLYGIKDEAFDPLMRLLDAGNQRDIETAPGQKGTAATKDSQITDKNATPLNVGSQSDGQVSATLNPNPNIAQKGMQATNDIPALVQKKGDLSPAQLKNILVLKQNEAADAQDIDKQTKLLTVQYNLQKDILGKGGYTEKLPYTFDADKNLIIRFMRPTDGDIVSKNLGRVTTEAIEKANIDADKPKGRFGAIQQANQIKSAYESDPTSYPKWQYDAAKSLLDDFEKTGQVKDAQIASLNQGISGTKPIQPAQTADDTRANKQMQLSIQKDIDEANAEVNAAKSRMNALEPDLKQATDTVVKADKDFANTEYGIEDPEYSKLRTDAEQARAAYNRIRAEYDKVSGDEVLAKNKLSGAQNRIKGINAGGDTNLKLKSAIDQVRKNNPKQTANWSDDQIVNYLRSKGLLK